MAKSSIHFEKTDASFAKKHNSREEEPTYLLPKKFWQGNTFEEIYTSKNLDVMYRWQCRKRKRLHRRGSTPTLKNSLTEAVVNLNSTHTLDDVKRVAQAIQEQYHFTPVSYAIHRDEGHMESRNGKTYPVYNYHAHVVFFTMAEGESQRRKLGSKELEEINTLTAKLLGMERGESKTQRWQRVADLLGVEVEQLWREKGESAVDYKERMRIFAAERGIEDFDIYKAVKPKKRLSAKQYREFAESMEKQKILTEKEVEERFKEEIKKDKQTISELIEKNTVLHNDKKSLNSELLTLKQQKEQIEAERKKYKADGDHLAEEYRKLQALNKTKHTQEELDKALAELRQQYEQRIKSKDKEITDLKEENTVLSNQEPKEIIKTVEVIKEVPRELTADEIKQTETYKNLALLDARIFTEVKGIGEEVSLTFKNDESLLTYIKNVKDKVHNTVLSNSQKPKEIIKTVEVVKEVPRALTISEIEELPRVQQLQQEIQSKDKYYKELLKPDMTDLKFNFLTVQDLEELKPKTTKKVLGMKLYEETPQAVVARFNKVLERRNEDVRLNYQKIKHKNTVLSNENNELKDENAELKSWKEIGLTLLHNVGFYIGEKLPSIENVKNTVKSFTSRLFSAFMMNNERDLAFVQNKIIDGQEYKQAQIDKQQQIEQAKQQQQIEQQVDQALGFGSTAKAHKDKEEQEHSHGMSM